MQPIAEFAPFHDGIASGELRLPRCAGCGRFSWYPLPGLLHDCGGTIGWTAVRPLGTVYASTTVRRPFLPGATRDDRPLATGLVELDDAPGIRIVVRFVDDLAAQAGTRVVGCFADVGDHPELRFEPDAAAAGGGTSSRDSS